MTDSQTAFIDSFNATLDEVTRWLSFTYDAKLQADTREQLSALLEPVLREKQTAINLCDEPFANILLGCECVTKAVDAELRMWLRLKDNQPDQAWSALVNAQGYVVDALRSDPGFGRLDSYVERLHWIERTVFPPQSFLSAGMIVEGQICDICGEDYEDQEKYSHIKGRAYMGKICCVRLIGCKPDHIALVRDPANKNCRILEVSNKSGVRDSLTGIIKPYADESERPEQGIKAKSIIATADSWNKA